MTPDENDRLRDGTLPPDPWADAEPVLSGQAGETPRGPGAASSVPRPVLDRSALHGLVGRFVELVEPHTEADPAAVAVQLLAVLGSLIGRTAFMLVGATKHAANLYVLLVGLTGRGRKGTSWDYVLEAGKAIQPTWSERVLNGLSTGEGLINAVRDPITKLVKDEASGELRTEVVDPGVADKRACIEEGEFGKILRVMTRESNTLSAVIRSAWDRADLGILTKSSPMRATGACITIVGHITRMELLELLSKNDANNGLANRFLYVWARRSKLLPEGGVVPKKAFDALVNELRDAVEFARSLQAVERDPEARALWTEVYPVLSGGLPGVLGAVTARAEAQVTRLQLLFAVLDRSPVVKKVHVEAALKLWSYCEDTCRFVWGDGLDDPVAERILRELRRVGTRGLSRSDLRDLFKRNKSREVLDRALSRLVELDLVRREIDRSGQGRPVERWFFGTVLLAGPAPEPEKPTTETTYPMFPALQPDSPTTEPGGTTTKPRPSATDGSVTRKGTTETTYSESPRFAAGATTTEAGGPTTKVSSEGEIPSEGDL